MKTAPDLAARVVPLLHTLAGFGGEGTGVTRLVYDDAWCEAQRWLATQARDLGLAATADAAGNLFLHDLSVQPGNPDRPVLLVGSHLDSVERGGRYDGAYGTIAALLLAAERRGTRGLPVVGFVTCEEEESRFHAGLMGARSLLGQVQKDELDLVLDGDGVSWRRALERARAFGCAAEPAAGERPIPPLFRAAAMLELHIEQGPVLETEELNIGIVEHIAGYRRMRVLLRGEPRHSGTTPMALRRDALAAAAEIILVAESFGAAAGPPAVATAGIVRARPGLYNVVPGEAEVGLEVRHIERAALVQMASELGRLCRHVTERRGVELVLEEVSRQDPTPLSPQLAATASELSRELGIASRRMTSGAAHDTMVFARAGIPSLLLFVPSRHGISHSPDEFTEPAQLETGYRFLAQLAARLSESTR
jgi:allantoate deiminase